MDGVLFELIRADSVSAPCDHCQKYSFSLMNFNLESADVA